jgi:DNA-binding transcriptional MocR family regulator
MALALTFLESYHKDGNEFPNHIVRLTGDETWVSFVNVETKEQSKQWINTHSPNKQKKFKQTLTAYQKADRNCFLRQNRVLMVGFMQQGITMMSEVYCETLK